MSTTASCFRSVLAATALIAVSAHAQSHAANHALVSFPFKGKVQSLFSFPFKGKAGMGMGSLVETAQSDLPAGALPHTPIPPITPADRRAAFPDVEGHAVHDNDIHAFWLLDQLEAWDARHGLGAGWEAKSWIGTDLDRIWLRSEGKHVAGSTEAADVELLYGRAVTPWWDLVAGVRHDFGRGPSQTFAAFGVQGLTPYKFELEATAYVGSGGQTSARLAVEYETLFTNRLILQWSVETEAYGKNDASRGIGSGFGTAEAGLRLRYEFTRRFAPYVGVVHEHAYGNTAELRQAAGSGATDTRLVVGIRTWF